MTEGCQYAPNKIYIGMFAAHEACSIAAAYLSRAAGLLKMFAHPYLLLGSLPSPATGQ